MLVCMCVIVFVVVLLVWACVLCFFFRMFPALWGPGETLLASAEILDLLVSNPKFIFAPVTFGFSILGGPES